MYNDFSLNSALQFTNSKIISLPMISHMWKLIHRIRFTDIEEVKVKLKKLLCRNCEEGILKEFIFMFKFNVTKLLIWRGNFFGCAEILDFKGKADRPRLFLFIANKLFYINTNRRRCNGDLYSTYMRSKLKTVSLLRFADDDMQTGLKIMVELLEA